MRNIPSALQSHIDQASTTTTRLLKITLRNGDVYGLTSLDRDVIYDDGSGEVTYQSAHGFDPSALSSDIDFSVDNSEAYALAAESGGITPEMVAAGELDDAQWVTYLVNYEDLSNGHVILDAGDVGEVKNRQDGMQVVVELLSYSMRLRQPIGSVYSRSCRAIFGSPANSQTGCGVDLAPLWATGEVQSVGGETTRVFTGDVVVDSSFPISPVPGRVEFLTGPNVGRDYSVESFDEGEISLNETTPYPIEAGDQYRIRPDCRKRYQQDCVAVWNNGVNFKGEPLIPVGDGMAIQAPGAQLPTVGGEVES